MKNLMISGIAVMAMPVLFWAQTPLPATEPPPSEIDQALRGRVNTFFQYMVENNFRKAMDMVADDTQDEFFNMGKTPLNWFKIDGITYSDGFTKAVVKTTSEKSMNIEGQKMKVPVPSATTWKIEKGLWVWYDNPAPVQLIDPGLVPKKTADQPVSNATGPPLTDEDLQAAIRGAFVTTASVDRSEVTLSATEASQASVVFHNGTQGIAQLQMSSPEIPGFVAKLQKTDANVLEDIRLSLSFDPTKGKIPADPITVQLTSLPSGQAFSIRVKFTQ